MSGSAFSTKGPSTGPSTQTVWFGGVIDRLNMLMPYNYPTARGTPNVPAHYGNLWNTFNSSLGGFTTAPDGTTNTAQLLVESSDTVNTIHYLQGGTFQGGGTAVGMPSGIPVGVLRIAAYLKQGTRTRVGFLLNNYDAGGSLVGILTVVFDLAGGQIGVPVSITAGGSATSQMVAKGTNISPAANGFYLCSQDFFFQDAGGGFLVAEIFLDAGSGTGALNNSYIGNGTSGAYVWRTNMMPVAAYTINNTIFFDDFTSLSTIDTTNSKAPGFNWYVDGLWDDAIENNTNNPCPANKLSVANSILTMLPPGNASGACIGTASQLNGPAGTFVGKGFGGGLPVLIEGKLSWDLTPPIDSNSLTFWTQSLEWTSSAGTTNTVTYGREFDMMEATGSGQTPNPDTDSLVYLKDGPNLFSPGGNFSLGFGNASYGFPPWQSTYHYGGNGNNRVISGGVVYSEVQSVNSFNNPPPNATFWTPLTYPSGGANALLQPAALTDFTQMHLYSTLVIPYWNQAGISAGVAQEFTQFNPGGNPLSTNGTVKDASVGLKMHFFDGLFVNMQSWGANLGGQAMHLSDFMHSQLFLNPGSTPTLQVDYVKVMQ